MKTKCYTQALSCILPLCFVFLQSFPVQAGNIQPTITVLLLCDTAESLEEVNVPEDFTWKTTRDLTINIQLLSTSPGTEGQPYAGQMVITILGDPDGDASFSQTIYQMMTDANGYLSAAVNIPSSWSQLKVIAQDTSTDPPSSTIQLSSSTTTALSINLHDQDPGTGEGV